MTKYDIEIEIGKDNYMFFIVLPEEQADGARKLLATFSKVFGVKVAMTDDLGNELINTF